MYVPKRFRPQSMEAISDYIRDNAFATVSSIQDDRIIAAHIPLLYDAAKNVLSGHVARANPIVTSLENGSELLAIFMQSHAYISSSWYDHVNVPTWNYISIHIYGKPKIIEGEGLLSSIRTLVDKYETGRDDRFELSQMDEKMLEAHIKGLVGFEISIDRIEAAYKLSQNRNDRDYQEIIDRLNLEGDELAEQVAVEMKKLRS